jgi:WD40 repeat protein
MNSLLCFVRRGQFLALLGLGAGLAGAALAEPPSPRLPTEAEAKEAQTRYRAEKEAVLKSGAADKFLPILVQKAEEMAKRGDAALEGGRLLQATEAFRQARWQLPYLPADFPAKVSRVLGSLRLRHGREVTSLAWSPDGKRLASASKDRTVRVWDMGNGQEVLRCRGHNDNVNAVAFSPDGKLIASAGGEPEVRLWDAATGKDLRTLKGEATFINAIAFSNDGKYLAAACDDRAMRIWEVASGALKRNVQDYRSVVMSVAFSPDGAMLASVAADGEFRLSNFPKMAEVGTEPAYYWSRQDFPGKSYHITFSPDSKVLARTGLDAVKLYNVSGPGAPAVPAEPRRIFMPLRAPTGKVLPFNCTAFSKDGKTLYIGGTDGTVYLYDPDNGQLQGQLKGHSAEIKALALGPDGTRLASASADHSARLWQLDVVAHSRDLAGHEGPVWTAYFSADGRRLVSASGDKTARIWDAISGKMLHALKGHELGVTLALFSPEGKTVVSAGGDKVLHLWDADKGELLRTCKGHTGTVTCADFSPDGKTIVSGGADQALKLWDAASVKELWSGGEPLSVVAAVAFSPDGKQIASGHIDQSVRLWNTEGKLLRSWSAHGAAVGGLAFSPDGKMLASGGADHLVKVWTLADLTAAPLVFSGHMGPVSSVAFRPDSKYLLSAGSDQVVKLWKLADGSSKDATQDFRGHKDWISSVTFSKDGYYLASASVDRLIKVWEVTARDIPLAAELTGAVLAVAVSPDGKTIASAGTDRTIRLWDRASGIEVLTLAGHFEEVLSLAFTPDGKTLVSTGADRNIKRWDTTTGRELPMQPGHQNNFVGLQPSHAKLVSVSADGQRVLAWIKSNERFSTIKVLDLASGNQLIGDTDRNRTVDAVAFAADGKKAALGAADGSVRIYLLEKAMDQLPGGDRFPFDDNIAIAALAFTPDGAALIAGSDKGEVKICGVAKKEIRHTLKAHTQSVGVIAVSADGKRFATAGNDNVIKLWDTASCKELAQWPLGLPVQERGGLVGALAFTPDGRALITANANTTLYVLELP